MVNKLFFSFQARPAYQVGNGRARGWCVKRQFAARSSSCEVSRCEVSEVHENRHEAFILHKLILLLKL